MKNNTRIMALIGGLLLAFSYSVIAKDNKSSNHKEHSKSKHDDHGEEKHDDHGEDKHDDHGEEKHDDHGEEKHDGHGEEKHDGHGEDKHDDHGEDKHDDHGEDKHDDHGKDKHADQSEGEHDEHESSKFGIGKAIEAFEPSKGLKLSKESINTLGIKFKEILNKNSFVVLRSSLVISKKLKGLYFLRDGFFKLLEVEFKSIDNDKYTVTVEGMRQGDKLVTDGVELLRVADVYSADDAEYGHGH